ncbi:hypothetical protein IVG45_19040 [Methylomonas sp. LL1]|uniref:hypothetical protein n=1 Tax=Methylomonas sp. LL1 TaxID=2785785 RepID=UPI0018C3E4EE|nr:hypothetical protein [Methylomonas sp. LL1]QPK62898.1 hypothetical protein IVG45_19040 [Methylomonas sp. LL1]
MSEVHHQTALSDFYPKEAFLKHPDNPLKESEFNWLFKNRETNGFKDAFVKVNARKFLVHIPGFTECLARRRGQ